MKDRLHLASVIETVRHLLADLVGESKPSESRSHSYVRYRTAVEMAWADQELNSMERERLDALADELALSATDVAEIERDVLGSSEIVSPPYPVRESENPLENIAWVDLAEKCVELVEELDRQVANFDPPRRELADHVILRLEEVLERSGVEVISEDTTFDRRRHKPEKAESQIASGAPITETLSPGFAIGPRVLRRARVRVSG